MELQQTQRLNSSQTIGKESPIRRDSHSRRPSGRHNKTVSLAGCPATDATPSSETLPALKNCQWPASSMPRNSTVPSIATILTLPPTQTPINPSMRAGLEELLVLLIQFAALISPASGLVITYVRLPLDPLPNSPPSPTAIICQSWMVPTSRLKRLGTGVRPWVESTTSGGTSIIITSEDHGYGPRQLPLETAISRKATPSPPIDLRILWFHIIFLISNS